MGVHFWVKYVQARVPGKIPSGATALGGPYGHIAVALVSGAEELRFDREWADFVRGTPLEGMERTTVFATLKFVDDSLDRELLAVHWMPRPHFSSG